jgi:hypothetical protein
MKLCIIDPAAHVPTLKVLFPEAEYYAHEPDDFFRHVTTSHYSKQQIRDEYGFDYRTDWNTISSSNYDYVFISVPLADYYDTVSPEVTQYCDRMKNKIQTILNSNTFKCVCLFDTYDYDYDPSKMNADWKVDFYFKRNYVKTRTYANNVFAFPYMMFVKPCVMKMAIQRDDAVNSVEKINKALWAGGIYNHTDDKHGIRRMRKDMYDNIKDSIDTENFSEKDFIAAIKRYKVVVDLIGVGNPNKRTFEILSSGTLMLTMCGELEWGFEDGDSFHPDTFFESAVEFKDKLAKILNNEDHYHECLSKQQYIVRKYFNKKWLRRYIQKSIQYPVNDTVSLFLTSCNRPALLRKTLESFVKFNTYPIEYGVIVEDSGLKGINDFAQSVVPFPIKIVYADARRGQMASIENGLQYLNTDYVFHCEEDWEFYNSGFIEDSMPILKNDARITSVRLRSYHELSSVYRFPIHPVENANYYIVGPDTGNYSWNPSLRTIEIQCMFSPYAKSNLVTICEGGLDKAFKSMGMTTALTYKKEGYVRHIGWNDHVY